MFFDVEITKLIKGRWLPEAWDSQKEAASNSKYNLRVLLLARRSAALLVSSGGHKIRTNGFFPILPHQNLPREYPGQLIASCAGHSTR